MGRFRGSRTLIEIMNNKQFEAKQWRKPVVNHQTKLYDLATPSEVTMFSAGYHPDVGVAWIEALQVHPEARGQGIGAKMVLAFEAWAAQQGATEVRGEALGTSMEFWESLGYELAGHLNNRNRTPVRRSLDRPNPREQDSLSLAQSPGCG